MVGSREMTASIRHVVYVGVFLFLSASLAGCAALGSGASARDGAEPNLGPTIGSVADVVRSQPIPVEGYGLVGGLSGTGSAICPPAVRNYLKQYILSQVPDGASNLDELINAPDTAVVHLDGVIPPMAMKGDCFDVRVTPVVGSDTTSLRGGRLYLADLQLPGTFGIDARTMATVEGPVFIDLLGTGEPMLKVGCVLGGGRASYDYAGIIHLHQADFRMASAIRNRVNERYGPETATAISSTDVGFRIPTEYYLRRERFAKLLTATYLVAAANTRAARTDAAVKQLAGTGDKEAGEITLEALGRESIAGLVPLLKSPDEETRLRAARCMLYLHDDRAVEALYAIATDLKSTRRAEAVETIAIGARRDDAGTILRRLLDDNDEQVVRTAFEHLRRLEDPAIREELINHDFYLDQAPRAGKPVILVFRSGAPRIVVLGSALSCRDSFSIESPGGLVTLTARAGDNGVSVVRRLASRRTRSASVRSSREVRDIIRTLGGDPTAAARRQPAGLGVSYTEITALLERVCAAKVVDAQFWPGPPTKFGQTVKK
jgi:hypothetical protein